MTAIGESIGRFRLLALLGAGGFASVYRAEDTELGREVAVKLLHEHLASNQAFVRRFRAEARAAARLRHPHIVTIHEVGETPEGRSYLVMALVEGAPLTRLVARDAPLPLVRVLPIVFQLASAIDYLHQRGLIHRDIKPANAVIGDSGEVTLMDFGISRSLDDQAHLTQTGEFIGTPVYMAPEQITGDGLGPAMDIYALGILTYELFAGRPPFTGSHSQVMDQQRFHPPPPLTNFNPNVPPPVVAVIEHALAKEPAKRPASAGAFATALAEAAVPPASIESDAAPPAPTERRRRPETRPALGAGDPAEAAARRRRWLLFGSLAAVVVPLVIVATLLTLRRHSTSSPAARSAPATAPVLAVKPAGQVPDADVLRQGATKVRRIDIAGGGSDPGAIVLYSQADAGNGCQKPAIDVLRPDASGKWGVVWDGSREPASGPPLLQNQDGTAGGCFPAVKLFEARPLLDGSQLILAASGYNDGSQTIAAFTWDTVKTAVAVLYEQRMTPGADVRLGDGQPLSLFLSENAYPPGASGLNPTFDKPIGRLSQTLTWQGNSFVAGDFRLQPNCSQGSLTLRADAARTLLLACPDGSPGPNVAALVTTDTVLNDGISFEDLTSGDDVTLTFADVSLAPRDPLAALPVAASVSSDAVLARKQEQQAAAAPSPTPQPVAPQPTAPPRVAPVVTPAPASQPVSRPAQQPAPAPASAAPTPQRVPVQSAPPAPQRVPVQP